MARGVGWLVVLMREQAQIVHVKDGQRVGLVVVVPSRCFVVGDHVVVAVVIVVIITSHVIIVIIDFVVSVL